MKIGGIEVNIVAAVGIAALALVIALQAPDRGGAPVADQSPTPAPIDREAERKAEEQKALDRAKGFHCLSSWDGSNRSLVNLVKKGLREPSSFEHIDTMIGPLATGGNHPTKMQYRARNGFGGMNVEEVVAAVSPESCEATIIETPAQFEALLGAGYSRDAAQ